MDYEEKYKDALEMARDAFYSPETPHFAKAWLLTLFPTIAESKDEQIRKKLLKAFGSMVKEQWGGIAIKDILAWLEKQGHMLDPDKVIEWVKTKVYDDSTYGMAMIDQFKKDFGL